MVRRTVLVALALLALACAAGGCSSSAPQSHTQAPAVIALGDSVPRGTNCNCKPYPQLSAETLGANAGKTTTATNDSVSGATSSDVLRQLDSDDSVISHVRAADVVEIEIGANDVAFSKSCGTAVSCYAPGVASVGKNLPAIVARVRELTSGHKALVVLLDYWSVWLGGEHAAVKGQAYVDAAASVTDEVDDIIKSTAEHSGSAYVNLRTAFKGPDYAYDETHYLADDGDHPNAAGHKQIAAATDAVIEHVLHI